MVNFIVIEGNNFNDPHIFSRSCKAAKQESGCSNPSMLNSEADWIIVGKESEFTCQR